MNKIILVNFILLTIYVYFFGYPSVQKYLKEGITTVTTEERDSGISPPGDQEQYNMLMFKMTLFF